MLNKKKKLIYGGIIVLLAILLLAVFLQTILTAAGSWLVVADAPPSSDAIVVLNSGIEIYPRLMQAAELYKKGYAGKIIINGNRKTDVLRELESEGFQGCCIWYEDSMRILELLSVPREKVVTISAEDAYDTVSEAEIVGRAIVEEGIDRIILATSKYHTRRARFIWKKMYEDQIDVYAVAAASDIYDPQNWWHEGRQIRWVLAEYGAWVYYYWQALREAIGLKFDESKMGKDG